MALKAQQHAPKRAVIRPEANEIYAKYLFPCTARYVFLFGSAGSGKSVGSSQKMSWFINAQQHTKHKILCIRKVYATIRESMYDRIINQLHTEGLLRRFKATKTPLKIIKKPTKGQQEHQQSSFVFFGMDNPEKIKSIEGITIVWVEEGTELTEQEFLQLDLRLRAETNGYHQFIMSFNPVSKDHWAVKYAEPQLLPKAERLEGMSDVRILEEGKVWEYDREVEFDGQKVTVSTRTINTTAADNRFLPTSYRGHFSSISRE